MCLQARILHGARSYEIVLTTMKQVLVEIQERREALAAHDFMLYLRDPTRSAAERLAYAPFCAHFVMTFSELNRVYLTDESSSDPQQRMINVHAREDGRHYSWYLKDLETLGYDQPCSFSQALRFLWSDLGQRGRDLSYYIVSVAAESSSSMRLAFVEAVEATGNVWLEATQAAVAGHPRESELIYFGPHHLERETGHTIGSDESDVASVVLGEEERIRAIANVHGLFDRMEAFCTEMLGRVDQLGQGTDFWQL